MPGVIMAYTVMVYMMMDISFPTNYRFTHSLGWSLVKEIRVPYMLMAYIAMVYIVMAYIIMAYAVIVHTLRPI